MGNGRNGQIDKDLSIYFNRINQYSLLTAEEEKYLGWRIINDNDPDAERELTESNLRLVVSIGKRFFNRGISKHDVIQYGNQGLMKAVKGFDPAMGNRFSTYATWWIKQAIRRGITDSRRTIRIPASVQFTINRIEMYLKSREVKEVDLDDIAKIVSRGDDPTQRDYTKAVFYLDLINTRTSSLTQLLSDGDMDFCRGSSPSPLEELDQGMPEAKELLRKLIDNAEEREKAIIKAKFGLDGEHPMTLKEIAKIHGISRERVRQVCNDLIGKLSNDETLSLLYYNR